tara:strand:- start:36 stop:380 length:345 start_codon:yes stop_codon:yes gene_type:complete
VATFPSINPTYGQRKNSAPKIRKVRFADGYEHRILFGLAEHQNPKEFNFTFEVSETDADTIETFLDARTATESFDFTPPGEASSSKFVCERWSKSIPYLNRATIQVTFREVFEP